MSTGYGWEGLRQVCVMLLGVRHVPERPCGGLVYLGRYNKCSPLPFCALTKTQCKSVTTKNVKTDTDGITMCHSCGKIIS